MDSASDLLGQLVDTASVEDLRAALLDTARDFDHITKVIGVLADTRLVRAMKEEEQFRWSTSKACAGYDKQFNEAHNKVGLCEHYRYHPGAYCIVSREDLWTYLTTRFCRD